MVHHVDRQKGNELKRSISVKMQKHNDDRIYPKKGANNNNNCLGILYVQKNTKTIVTPKPVM